MRRTLAVCALAAVLALTGCAGRGQARSDVQPAGTTSTQAHQSTSAKSTSSSTKTGADDATADLAAVDSQLNGLDKDLSNLNAQITDADKAADDDN